MTESKFNSRRSTVLLTTISTAALRRTTKYRSHPMPSPLNSSFKFENIKESTNDCTLPTHSLTVHCSVPIPIIRVVRRAHLIEVPCRATQPLSACTNTHTHKHTHTQTHTQINTRARTHARTRACTHSPTHAHDGGPHQ